LNTLECGVVQHSKPGAPILDVALQALVQGILTAIVALLLYGRMVGLLGATAGAAFVALTPATTALLGIPVLGEWPCAIDCVAIASISVGVYLVSGGPLPARRASFVASRNA
jgi:drug/metabolite transporter (DMT)-like permease